MSLNQQELLAKLKQLAASIATNQAMGAPLIAGPGMLLANDAQAKSRAQKTTSDTKLIETPPVDVLNTLQNISSICQGRIAFIRLTTEFLKENIGRMRMMHPDFFNALDMYQAAYEFILNKLNNQEASTIDEIYIFLKMHLVIVGRLRISARGDSEHLISTREYNYIFKILARLIPHVSKQILKIIEDDYFGVSNRQQKINFTIDFDKINEGLVQNRNERKDVKERFENTLVVDQSIYDYIMENSKTAQDLTRAISNTVKQNKELGDFFKKIEIDNTTNQLEVQERRNSVIYLFNIAWDLCTRIKNSVETVQEELRLSTQLLREANNLLRQSTKFLQQGQQFNSLRNELEKLFDENPKIITEFSTLASAIATKERIDKLLTINRQILITNPSNTVEVDFNQCEIEKSLKLLESFKQTVLTIVKKKQENESQQLLIEDKQRVEKALEELAAVQNEFKQKSAAWKEKTEENRKRIEAERANKMRLAQEQNLSVKTTLERRRAFFQDELKKRETRITDFLQKITASQSETIKHLFNDLYTSWTFDHKKLTELIGILKTCGETITLKTPSGGSSHYTFKITIGNTYGYLGGAVETGKAFKNDNDRGPFSSELIRSLRETFTRAGYTREALQLTSAARAAL